MNKKGKETIITYLLVTLILICQIFRYKSIFLDPNSILEASISNLIYPFTFLLIILLYKKSNFNIAHKTILKTTLTFLIFMLIVSILNSIPGNYYSKEIDISLKTILTPNYFVLFNHSFYYPSISNLLSFSMLFYFSHTIILILYEAMEPYTNKFISFSLSMFIPYTLDMLCYTIINNSFNNIDFNKMITNLTSNFILVIIFTIIVSIIYTIKNKIKSE